MADLQQVLTERRAAQTIAYKNLKEAENKLRAITQERKDIEYKMQKIPGSELYGGNYAPLWKTLLQCEKAEQIALREHAQADTDKCNADMELVSVQAALPYVDHESWRQGTPRRRWALPTTPQSQDSRLISSPNYQITPPREALVVIPPPEPHRRVLNFDEVLQKVEKDQRTVDIIHEATLRGYQLKESAIEKQTKLQKAEQDLQEIKQKIDEHVKNGESGEQITNILEGFQKVSAVLDKKATDCAATKAKAMAAFKLAESLRKKVNIGHKLEVPEELKLLYQQSIRKTGIPKLTAVKGTGLKPEEVHIKRDIEQNLGNLEEITKKVQQNQQRREVMNQKCQRVIKNENIDEINAALNGRKLADDRLKLSVGHRKEMIAAMCLKLEEILKKRQRHSKDFLNYVQGKLNGLKQVVGNVQATSEII
jgi:hypothetical protein